LNLIEKLEKKLSHKFKRISILKDAVTHSSYVNEKRSVKTSYERLEFLGDAVLELAISDILMKKFPKKDEGELTKARSLLVRKETLLKISKNLELSEFIRLGKGEIKEEGKNKSSILACVTEAIIGAIYQDSGFKKAYKFIDKNWASYIDEVFNEYVDIDYKSRFQRVVQKIYKLVPEYEILGEKNGIFTSRVKVLNVLMTKGSGKSKKMAEQDAAKKGIDLLSSV
jgi:ribonuclease III